MMITAKIKSFQPNEYQETIKKVEMPYITLTAVCPLGKMMI